MIGFAGSVGRSGNAFCEAFIASTIELDETELVKRRRIGCDTPQELEAVTTCWVAWFNQDHLHAELGYRTPMELEVEYVCERALLTQAV